MSTRSLRRLAPLAILGLLPLASFAQERSFPLPGPSVNYKIQFANERLDMTIHSSRILTMEQKIVQAQANNPDLLDLVVLAPNQVQISAKALGTTQVNLWGEDKKLFSIDVNILNDVRALEMMLRSQYPAAALQVVPVGNSVMIRGFVDQPDQIDRIIRIAEEYYPKVINGMVVGGVQQVLLHVKVMEVSRTKLRHLGFDWAKMTGSNMVVSGVSGLLADFNPTQATSPGMASRTGTPGTFAFSIVNGSSAFYGVLDALRHDNLLKISSEPTVVSLNGRPASFMSGGEIPVPEPQSLGTISISWKKYGTQIDFVPLVLGNGKIHLDVRSEISELDQTRSFNIQGTQVPGIKTRKADTGVELVAGQTLAIAGLMQTFVEAENMGLPWISEVPYLGAAFRNVRENRNEVELLIMVTPELVEALDPCEVPPCGPGSQTTSPNDWELYMKGHLEVPNRCSPRCGNGAECRPNGDGDAPPPDGMMPAPGEPIPAPAPGSAARNSRMAGNNAAGQSAGVAVAQRSPGAPSNQSGPYNRYAPSKSTPVGNSSSSGSPANPPALIGPIGYDVVK